MLSIHLPGVMIAQWLGDARIGNGCSSCRSSSTSTPGLVASEEYHYNDYPFRSQDVLPVLESQAPNELVGAGRVWWFVPFKRLGQDELVSAGRVLTGQLRLFKY